MKMVESTLEAMVIERPAPTAEAPQNLCMDKGYDYPQVKELVERWGYTAHIRSRGEERQEKEQIPGYRARRWVVERTHSWLNRSRSRSFRIGSKKADIFDRIIFQHALKVGRKCVTIGHLLQHR